MQLIHPGMIHITAFTITPGNSTRQDTVADTEVLGYLITDLGPIYGLTALVDLIGYVFT
jgi:hypothetical protein